MQPGNATLRGMQPFARGERYLCGKFGGMRFAILWTLVGMSLGFGPSNIHAQRTCGMDSVQTHLMGLPNHAASHQLRMNAMRDVLDAHGERADCDNVLMIPVAAHFQNTGIPLACAIDMALSQVEAMNADFAGTNADIGEWIDQQPGLWPNISNGESCIQFCLATMNHPPGFGLAEGDYAVTLDQTNGDNDPGVFAHLLFEFLGAYHRRRNPWIFPIGRLGQWRRGHSGSIVFRNGVMWWKHGQPAISPRPNHYARGRPLHVARPSLGRRGVRKHGRNRGYAGHRWSPVWLSQWTEHCQLHATDSLAYVHGIL